jgi:hypothetical protein
VLRISWRSIMDKQDRRTGYETPNDNENYIFHDGKDGPECQAERQHVCPNE